MGFWGEALLTKKSREGFWGEALNLEYLFFSGGGASGVKLFLRKYVFPKAEGGFWGEDMFLQKTFVFSGRGSMWSEALFGKIRFPRGASGVEPC